LGKSPNRVPAYAYYVLGVLVLGYLVNVMDRAVLAVLLESIKREFTLSDAQLGLLSGLSFALFYATLGIPIAIWADRWNRRNVLALAIATWSVMTALCGLASSFSWLLLARAGTAAGEAGGTPPSHALISDYFSRSKRATALAIYALGVPLGAWVGSQFGGAVNYYYDWRTTFIVIGLPGIAVALLVAFTVREPPRGMAENLAAAAAKNSAPPILEVLRYLWRRTSFRHICLAAALHSVVWYSGSQLNASFFQRSHGMTSKDAGFWLGLLAAIGAIGTFVGGYLADRLSVLNNDRRWYARLPGLATLAMVPFQFVAYLTNDHAILIASFAIMTILASFFFGPSFAMTQGLAPVRMRAVATSILLFVQTMIGQGIGPYLAGRISDQLHPAYGRESLRYALVVVGLVNIWAAFHYFWGARTLRADFDATERAQS
jgi:MFS family permease